MRNFIDPKHLITLESVARLGSFAAAADELAYTQSAVSQQISEIERKIDLLVLERRPVKITQAGNILLEAELAVRTATAVALQELDSLRKGHTGSIKFAAFTSAAAGVAPSLLAHFKDSYPNIQITLKQHETEASYARILRGELDIALVFDYNTQSRQPPERIKRSFVSQDPVYVVLPTNHRLADNDQIDLSELVDETWIGSPVTGQQLELISKFSRINTLKLGLQFEGDDFQTILSLVEHGLGITLLPKLITLRAPKEVVAKPIVGSPLTRYLYTARLQTEHPPAALLIFEEKLSEILQHLMIN